MTENKVENQKEKINESKTDAKIKTNPMRDIRVEKITINIGTGEPGNVLEKARKMLTKITGKKVVTTKCKKRNTFGGTKDRPIGVKVTIRKAAAKELLLTLLQAVDGLVKESQFDVNGNFSFGIAEYISIPGIKYDPDIGMIGMDVCVTLSRPGFSINKRALRSKKIGKAHRIKKEDAVLWATENLGIKTEEKEE